MIPETATKKLAALVQQAEDARALAFAAKERAGVLEGKVIQLHNAHGSFAEITKAAEQHEAALDLQRSRYVAWQQNEELVTRLRSWINELPRNVTLETMPSPVMALNGTFTVTVAEIRTQIGKLATQHHAIRTADAPLDDAKRQARELVAALGKRPAIDTQFGELHVRGWTAAEQFGPTFHDKTIATLCWLVPDTVITKLDEALEQMPRNADALPVSERASRLAEIEAEIALLETREEFLIERAAEDNIVIERRHDQSPVSILGLRIAPATARAAA